jgi:TP901-1 family phage major tail protein
MAQIGFSKKLYLQLVKGMDNYTMLKGETSSSISLSADVIEVSDKETSWKKYVAGYKGGTIDATVYADPADEAQQALMDALFNGTEVQGFIGEVDAEGSAANGFDFAAIVTSVGETYDTGSAIARTISLQITGEVTKF